jgi:hypothetical protein
MDYEKLRDPQTAKELPIGFSKEFEEALSKAVGYWQQNGFLVDRFEDNAMECSFAKGFLAGCIYMENKNKDK